jgi:outer membrane lipoprotein-sorting protein
MHREKIHVWAVTIAAAVAVEGWAFYVVSASHIRWEPSMVVKDEPAAHALYDAMIDAMRKANTLSYTAVCSGPDERATTYQVWLKKPNLFHLELANYFGKDTTLVGDDEHLWIYWPDGRPFRHGEDPNDYETTRSNIYVKRPTPVGADAIGNEIARLEMTWYGIILDPGMFSSSASPSAPAMDGIRSRGPDKVGKELCDVVEMSFAATKRTRYIWLARSDHLPRKAKEITRDATLSIVVEEWHDVTVNPAIPPNTFTWTPPDTWTPWTSGL